MSKSKNTKNYTPEFRLEVCELVVKHGFSVREAAKAMGVSKSGVNKWVQTYKNRDVNSINSSAVVTPEQVEIKRLRKQVADLQECNEILKKASALKILSTIIR